MISKSKFPSNVSPNINTVLAHKREHFETYNESICAIELLTCQNYSLREILGSINRFKELKNQALSINDILDFSDNVSLSEKLYFKNELNRICELCEIIITDLNHAVDQICEGKKSHKTFQKIEPNLVLLRKLMNSGICRLNLIIDPSNNI